MWLCSGRVGVFQIPQVTAKQYRSDPRIAIIQVTDGALRIPNMISELERLIPTKWAWKVVSIRDNSFRTVFSNKAELQRMVEWGCGLD
jgi:hypothetical protein